MVNKDFQQVGLYDMSAKTFRTPAVFVRLMPCRQDDIKRDKNTAPTSYSAQ